MVDLSFVNVLVQGFALIVFICVAIRGWHDGLKKQLPLCLAFALTAAGWLVPQFASFREACVTAADGVIRLFSAFADSACMTALLLFAVTLLAAWLVFALTFEPLTAVVTGAFPHMRISKPVDQACGLAAGLLLFTGRAAIVCAAIYCIGTGTAGGFVRNVMQHSQTVMVLVEMGRKMVGM